MFVLLEWLCQTFISPGRIKVQKIMCEEEPWHVLRINHIMCERKTKKLSASFHVFFILCWDTVSVWTLSFLVCAMKERGVCSLLIPETQCKAADAYVGILLIFSFNGTTALYELYTLSCTNQNLTFSRRAPCILFKIGFCEFRWVECLFTWFTYGFAITN